ncbi:MAG: TIGR03943 family protein [Lachnospiraceae bacterium]|nr:TIGR03943 family protein [Lachnospiraceae bacterium]MDY5741463.1 TIGR03943 family protein [Lachnospiraceae bacterium]
MKHKRRARKPWNMQVLLELATQAFFTAVMIYLITSRLYLKYVTPRLLPYLIGMIVVMVLWMVITAAGLRRFTHRPRFAHNFILLLPALFFLLPHDPTRLATTGQSAGNALTAIAVQNKDASAADTSGKGDSAPLSKTDANGKTAAPDNQTAVTPKQNKNNVAKPQPEIKGTKTEAGGIISDDGLYHVKNTFGLDVALSGLDPAAKRITISHKDFYPWLSEIFGHVKSYQGYTISISGFVFRDKSFGERFLLARNMMTCCVADLAPAGILCLADNIPEADQNKWFTFTGTISSVTNLGRTEPLLLLQEVTDCEVPNDPYIYPF